MRYVGRLHHRLSLSELKLMQMFFFALIIYFIYLCLDCVTSPKTSFYVASRNLEGNLP